MRFYKHQWCLLKVWVYAHYNVLFEAYVEVPKVISMFLHIIHVDTIFNFKISLVKSLIITNFIHV
jgi:hypothetical protein